MSIMGAFMVPHPPIIIEEIGHRREKGIEPIINAYAEVANLICELQPETIVFISPHSTSYSDYFHISGGISSQRKFWRIWASRVRFSKRN
jgi:MEMO1 family protein